MIAAYCRLPDPQIPIMKYIGTRTSSQNTKNRTRSKATKVPAMPVSSSSISARKARGRPGLGMTFQEYTAQRNDSSSVSSSSGRLMPSTPT